MKKKERKKFKTIELKHKKKFRTSSAFNRIIRLGAIPPRPAPWKETDCPTQRYGALWCAMERYGALWASDAPWVDSHEIDAFNSLKKKLFLELWSE